LDLNWSKLEAPGIISVDFAPRPEARESRTGFLSMSFSA